MPAHRFQKASSLFVLLIFIVGSDSHARFLCLFRTSTKVETGFGAALSISEIENQGVRFSYFFDIRKAQAEKSLRETTPGLAEAMRKAAGGTEAEMTGFFISHQMDFKNLLEGLYRFYRDLVELTSGVITDSGKTWANPHASLVQWKRKFDDISRPHGENSPLAEGVKPLPHRSREQQRIYEEIERQIKLIVGSPVVPLINAILKILGNTEGKISNDPSVTIALGDRLTNPALLKNLLSNLADLLSQSREVLAQNAAQNAEVAEILAALTSAQPGARSAQTVAQLKTSAAGIVASARTAVASTRNRLRTAVNDGAAAVRRRAADRAADSKSIQSSSSANIDSQTELIKTANNVAHTVLHGPFAQAANRVPGLFAEGVDVIDANEAARVGLLRAEATRVLFVYLEGIELPTSNLPATVVPGSNHLSAEAARVVGQASAIGVAIRYLKKLLNPVNGRASPESFVLNETPPNRPSGPARTEVEAKWLSWLQYSEVQTAWSIGFRKAESLVGTGIAESFFLIVGGINKIQLEAETPPLSVSAGESLLTTLNTEVGIISTVKLFDGVQRMLRAANDSVLSAEANVGQAKDKLEASSNPSTSPAGSELRSNLRVAEEALQNARTGLNEAQVQARTTMEAIQRGKPSAINLLAARIVEAQQQSIYDWRRSQAEIDLGARLGAHPNTPVNPAMQQQLNLFWAYEIFRLLSPLDAMELIVFIRHLSPLRRVAMVNGPNAKQDLIRTLAEFRSDKSTGQTEATKSFMERTEPNVSNFRAYPFQNP